MRKAIDDKKSNHKSQGGVGAATNKKNTCKHMTVAFEMASRQAMFTMWSWRWLERLQSFRSVEGLILAVPSKSVPRARPRRGPGGARRRVVLIT
jgi:hypothetical protein